MSAKGGITEGKSHKEGGIPMEVKSTGQQVELEGGEAVINKRNMASEKKFDFQGKKMTTCEIASEINSADGNGVKIDCDNVTGTKYKYDKGGSILDETQEVSFKDWMEDGNVIEWEENVYSTQDAQYSNRLKGMDELRKYYRKEFLSDSYNKGGSINVETYDYNQLIGKYVNIYSMGVELPSEHKVEGIMFSSPQFRYRDLTLKFDRGIAPIKIQDINTFLNNEIVYVNDNKEDFGIQLIPNQFAKGGKTDNNMKLEDFKTASISMGNYEEGAISSNPTEFANGGDVRDMSWFQDFKKQELKRGTEHEMEHIDTIKKFKKEGVSDKEVAEAIAKDHLDENDSYYIELDEMEKSSKKVSDTLNEFEKQKSYRKNDFKYAQGGFTINNKEKVHLMFLEGLKAVLRAPNGKYITESIFSKDKIYTFYFINNNGTNTTLEFDKTGVLIIVPSDKINIVGFKQSYAMGGSIYPYQSLNLDENDRMILKALRLVDNINDITSKEKNFFSSFKGDNVVNQLSNSLIQKIYGLLFKYHNLEHPIKNLLLSNIGVGNILLFAPSYLDHTYFTFDETNKFNEIDKEISSIINYPNRSSLLSNESELKNVDAIIHVYPVTNPYSDELVSLFFKTKSSGGTALGVCEFTTLEALQKFENDVRKNQGGVSQNQMMLLKSINSLIIGEGITNKGTYTLIYIMNK